jgi:hypothetical protein
MRMSGRCLSQASAPGDRYRPSFIDQLAAIRKATHYENQDNKRLPHHRRSPNDWHVISIANGYRAPYHLSQPHLSELVCHPRDDTPIEIEEDKRQWSIPSPQLGIINLIAQHINNGIGNDNEEKLRAKRSENVEGKRTIGEVDWMKMFEVLSLTPTKLLSSCRVGSLSHLIY